MRYSTESEDPGYTDYVALREAGTQVHTFLDGVEVHQVWTVDAEAGFLVRAVCDELGPLVDKERNAIFTERLEGNVSIELRERRDD